MSRETYVWRDGRLVLKGDAGPAPKLHVIGDSIDAFKSMADGKMYDSKSRYYRDIKARGYEIVGNEPMKPRNREPDARRLDRVLDSVMRGE